MSAAEALQVARSAGVRLGIDGDDLVLEATAPPPPEVLDLLSQNKAELLTLLRYDTDVWSAEDWHAFFDERAGIAQFDGGLSRGEAETRALQACVAEWLHRNPEPSPAGLCALCRHSERNDAVVVPFGVGEHHTWLHPRCWPVWFRERQIKAVEALRAIGIPATPVQEEANLD